MNNKISMAVSFVIGAVIGSAVSIRFLKNKYINMANEEIESVKEVLYVTIEEDELAAKYAEMEGSDELPF